MERPKLSQWIYDLTSPTSSIFRHQELGSSEPSNRLNEEILNRKELDPN